MMHWIILYFKACLMGLADLIPGVSGGTVAYVTGIYPRLIKALSCVDKEFFSLLVTFKMRPLMRHIDAPFLCIIMAGIISAILFFTKWLDAPGWIESNEVIFYRFCLCMMALAIYYLIKKTPVNSYSSLLILTVGIGLGVALLALEPAAWPDSPIFFFLSGAIAITAMILPGISGSFLLVILGKYTAILYAVKEDQYEIIALFLLGAMTGVIMSAKILNYFLTTREKSTLTLVNGFVIGCTLLLIERAAF